MNFVEKNIKLIIDNQYFGIVNWYKYLFKFSHIEIEQYDSYQKMSFRNRTVIAGSNGLINLSVPLIQGRTQRTWMKDVRISYQDAWQEQHWRSIYSCYGKSPFFEFYKDGLYELLQKRCTFLIDLNELTRDWVLKQYKLNLTIYLTQSFIPNYGDGYADYRDQIKPQNFREVKDVIKYPQVFEDRISFVPNLSMLDFLFCCGPEGKSFIQNSISKI